MWVWWIELSAWSWAFMVVSSAALFFFLNVYFLGLRYSSLLEKEFGRKLDSLDGLLG